MIWDRWEDAMHDLDDDKAVAEREIAALKDQLAARGIAIPERAEQPAAGADTGSHAHDMFVDRGREVSAVEHYRNCLRKLLRQFDERKRRNRRRAIFFFSGLLVCAVGFGLWQVMTGYGAATVASVAGGQHPISVDISLPEEWDIETRVANALMLRLSIDRHPRLAITAGNILEQTQVEPGSALPLPTAHYTVRWSAHTALQQLEVSMRRVARPAEAQRVRLLQQDGESDIAFVRRLVTALALHAQEP